MAFPISRKVNKAGEKAKAAGIQLCYHNHSFEFGPLGGEVPYEVLIKELDPELVKFELDVFWVSIGGYDPVELMNRLGKRVGLVHLKDKMEGLPTIYDEGKVPPEAFKELGNGVVDLKEVIAIAAKNKVPYCFVEQDQSPDPIKSVEESVTFMKGV